MPELDQAARRRRAVYTDQHGRRWETQNDILAGAPCAPLTPLGWTAPWVPPQESLKVGTDDARTLTIDYDAVIEQRDASLKSYNQIMWEEARRMFGAAAAERIERRDPMLLAEVGPPPEHSRWARAARSGQSKWILGLAKPDGSSYPIPGWAAPFVHELVHTYVFDSEAGDEDYRDDDGEDAPAAAGGYASSAPAAERAADAAAFTDDDAGSSSSDDDPDGLEEDAGQTPGQKPAAAPGGRRGRQAATAAATA